MSVVYALGDPRTNEIRYIGIAQDIYKRYAQHLNHPHHNEAKDKWMTDLKQHSLLPTLTILEADIISSALLWREQYWIALYLAQGAPLTNIRIYGPPLEPKEKHTAQSETKNIDIRQNENDSFSLDEVIEMFQISRRTIFRLIEKNELTGFKVGRAWRFEESDIDEYIDRQRQKAKEATQQESSEPEAA